MWKVHDLSPTRLFCAVPALLALLSLAVWAGDEMEVRVEPSPQAWVSQHAMPVRLSVWRGHGGNLHTVTSSTGWRVTANSTLPPGSPVYYETSSVMQYGGVASWNYEGLIGSERIDRPSYGYRHISGERAVIGCINGYLLRELEGIDKADKPEDLLIRTLDAEQLPRRWQSYAGLMAVLVMDTQTASSLDRERREALSRWVRWMGGNADAAAAALELALPKKPSSSAGKVDSYRLLNGYVHVQADPDALALANYSYADRIDPFSPYYLQSDTDMATDWLLETLQGVSVGFIVISLIILGIILGPVNYLYVRQKGNFLLFYLITPIIAALGAVAIIFGSMAVEGLGSRYNQAAVLVRNGDTDEAMLYDLRGVRVGFTTPTLRFPGDSLLLPLESPQINDEMVMDMSDGVTLVSGWLKPRFSTGYLAALPVVARMNVEVGGEGEDYYVENGLGFALERVVARLPGGVYGWVEGVPPGGRASLRLERTDLRFRQLQNEYERVFGERTAFSGVNLVARAAGLPYQDDGGLGGSRLTGEYYFVSAGNGGGAGE